MHAPRHERGAARGWQALQTWTPQSLADGPLAPAVVTARFGRRSANDTLAEGDAAWVNCTLGSFARWLLLHESADTAGGTAGAAVAAQTDEPPPCKAKRHCGESDLARALVDDARFVAEQDPGFADRGSVIEDAGVLVERFPPSEYWGYASYQRMHAVLVALRAEFGFEDLGAPGDAENMAIWFASPDACTPCHYDTYGHNVAVQLYGRKRWTLFDPGQSEALYATRLPYEESTVFSAVDLRRPDLARFPRYAAARTHSTIVEMAAGDALHIPRHWWHFVESVGVSVSINEWVAVRQDAHEACREAVVRAIFGAFFGSSTERQATQEHAAWLNPGERPPSITEALGLVATALAHRDGESEASAIPISALVDALCKPAVLDSVLDTLGQWQREAPGLSAV